MGNQTIMKELFLSGLSDISALQLPLFIFILLIYLLTVICNSLIIILLVIDSHLHVPMYFFLGNLACLDLCSSSVTVPRMLFDLHTKERKITITACMTQASFVIFFAVAENFLLSIMSYDRYTAICQPLHYVQIMSWKSCIQLTFIAWALSFAYSLVHTFFAFQLTFCDLNVINSFFCDLPQLFQISCSDIFINILLVFLWGIIFGFGCLLITFLSYVYILKNVLKMKLEGTRSKLVFTCTSHLTVVLLFYGSGFFNYLQLNASHRFASNKVASIIYTVILPLLNPLIYSLRNQDFRKAFQNIFHFNKILKAQ